MIFSKDYIGYLARQTTKHLIAAKMIKTDKPEMVNQRVAAALIEELALEDRINEEVRVILEAFQEDMHKSGASYPEMFKKVKMELARKYKAVLLGSPGTSSTSWLIPSPTPWPRSTRSSSWRTATRSARRPERRWKHC